MSHRKIVWGLKNDDGCYLWQEKEPPEGYIGKHAFWNDHDRIGQNNVIWLGCKMCREQLGMSDPPRKVVSDPKNWHEPSL
jgi:hypothetical protein